MGIGRRAGLRVFSNLATAILLPLWECKPLCRNKEESLKAQMNKLVNYFGKSVERMGAFYPTHCLVAVFRNPAGAEGIEAAREELAARGAKVSEVFHAGRPGAQFQPDGASGRVAGPAPDRASYGSFATFRDPEGNAWLLQEVTARLPGRVAVAQTAFASANDLASALRRAEAAHGQHEKRTGQRDANWPAWYAEYMVAEQTGQELPQ